MFCTFVLDNYLVTNNELIIYMYIYIYIYIYIYYIYIYIK